MLNTDRMAPAINGLNNFLGLPDDQLIKNINDSSITNYIKKNEKKFVNDQQAPIILTLLKKRVRVITADQADQKKMEETAEKINDAISYLYTFSCSDDEEEKCSTCETYKDFESKLAAVKKIKKDELKNELSYIKNLLKKNVLLLIDHNEKVVLKSLNSLKTLIEKTPTENDEDKEKVEKIVKTLSDITKLIQMDPDDESPSPQNESEQSEVVQTTKKVASKGKDVVTQMLLDLDATPSSTSVTTTQDSRHPPSVHEIAYNQLLSAMGYPSVREITHQRHEAFLEELDKTVFDNPNYDPNHPIFEYMATDEKLAHQWLQSNAFPKAPDEITGDLTQVIDYIKKNNLTEVNLLQYQTIDNRFLQTLFDEHPKIEVLWISSRSLTALPSNKDYPLKVLYSRDCAELKEIPDSFTQLEFIDISGCLAITAIPGFLDNLRILLRNTCPFLHLQPCFRIRYPKLQYSEADLSGEHFRSKEISPDSYIEFLRKEQPKHLALQKKGEEAIKAAQTSEAKRIDELLNILNPEVAKHRRIYIKCLKTINDYFLKPEVTEELKTARAESGTHIFVPLFMMTKYNGKILDSNLLLQLFKELKSYRAKHLDEYKQPTKIDQAVAEIKKQEEERKKFVKIIDDYEVILKHFKDTGKFPFTTSSDDNADAYQSLLEYVTKNFEKMKLHAPITQQNGVKSYSDSVRTSGKCKFTEDFTRHVEKSGIREYAPPAILAKYKPYIFDVKLFEELAAFKAKNPQFYSKKQ